jgi:hypothetical protein
VIPFVIVKTKVAFAYLRPEHIVAVSATDPGECLVLMTDGVTITAFEPAEDGRGAARGGGARRGRGG